MCLTIISKHVLVPQVDGLQRCPYDPKHYVPGSSLETHKVKCWYGTHGVKVDTNTAQILTSRSTFYGEGSTIPHIHIGMHNLVPNPPILRCWMYYITFCVLVMY